MAAIESSLINYKFTTPTSNWIKSELSELYREYIKLIEVESLNDSENEPFKSLYLGRDKLFLLKEKIETSSTLSEISLEEDKNCLIICVHSLLGLNYLKTDERSSAQLEFETVLDLAKGVACTGKVAISMVTVLNHLGVLWSDRSEEYEKSLELLLEAKNIYDKINSSRISHSPSPPLSFPPLGEQDWLTGEIRNIQERENEFENLHTHTLFYLAQVYTHLDQPDQSAHYCQATLSRQLETKVSHYDPLDWSINAATLSQYYINTNNFPQARHCLAAATVVFGRYDNEDESGAGLSEEKAELKEKVQRTKADISRCWTKYCILLLTMSLSNDSESEGTREKYEIVHRFEPLELEGIENEVTCDWIENHRIATSVFLFATKHIRIAKEYYNLQDFASHYVSVIQDHSQLYKLLTTFENDLVLKCRMLKRRIDMLLELVSTLNPQYYLVLNRQLMFELGDIYSEMANHKIVLASDGDKGNRKDGKVTSGSDPSLHQIRKINSLLQDAIKHYQNYFESFPSSEEDQIEPSYLKSYLTSKLNVARVYGKLIGYSLGEQVRHLETSLGGYQWLVNYATKHENKIVEVFEEEIKLCKEMIGLLPQKIELIRIQNN